jgi:16S rRNA (cytosine967-C5)-methyltransferase
LLPSARVNATLELMDRIANSRIPMDSATGDYMRQRRYIGSKDRAEIAARLYNIARARARLNWWLARTGAEDTSRNRMIIWLAVGENATGQTMQRLFDDTTYGPEILNRAEIQLFEKVEGQNLDHPDMPDYIRAEVPEYYMDSLRRYFGADFETEMAALIPPATLDLRVNSRSADREKVINSLKQDGIEAAPTKYSPWALRLSDKAFLSKTKALTKGWIEIQDEGSQLIAYACNAQPGQQVLDYCAGTGGKTLALAAAMNNKGRLVAMDLEARRLEKARTRFRRSYVSDIIEIRPLEDEKNRKWLRRQKETFDVTLVDVPCTGTGTWRRNPDMRWKVYGPDLAELLATQAEILDRVAKTIKPETGRLVYATCSLLPEENEDQVSAFLERHPDFKVLPLAQAWPDDNAPCDGDFMRLTPHRHGTDGFFAAVLVHKDYAVHKE